MVIHRPMTAHLNQNNQLTSVSNVINLLPKPSTRKDVQETLKSFNTENTQGTAILNVYIVHILQSLARLAWGRCRSHDRLVTSNESSQLMVRIPLLGGMLTGEVVPIEPSSDNRMN